MAHLEKEEQAVDETWDRLFSKYESNESLGVLTSQHYTITEHVLVYANKAREVRVSCTTTFSS